MARWWEEIINPDGSIGRRRRAEVLGTVAELPSRSTRNGGIVKTDSIQLTVECRRPQSTRSISQSFMREGLAARRATNFEIRNTKKLSLHPRRSPAYLRFGSTRLCGHQARVQSSHSLLQS